MAETTAERELNNDLRKALSAIEGVERSEVELAENGPLAIRVELAHGADRRTVGEAVQRLLEAHGLRSRVAPDRREPSPGSPPAPPPGLRHPAADPGPIPGPPGVVVEPPGPPIQPPVSGGIEAVTVFETMEGLMVTVVADGGRTAVRRARRTEPALHEAIVAAVGELNDSTAPPVGLLAVEHSEAFAAITVYLEGSDGQILAGVAVVAASHPFAFARAVWAALQD